MCVCVYVLCFNGCVWVRMSQPVPVVLRRGVTEMVCHRGSGCAEADESTAE